MVQPLMSGVDQKHMIGRIRSNLNQCAHWNIKQIMKIYIFLAEKKASFSESIHEFINIIREDGSEITVRLLS